MTAETKKRERSVINAPLYDDEDEEMEFEDDTTTAVQTTTTMTMDPSSSAASSTNNAPKVVTPKKSAVTTSKQQTQFSPELLKQYYSRLFPYSLLTQWLSYNPNIGTTTATMTATATTSASNHPAANTNNGKLFSHREFSFTIEPAPGDEIYIRYQSFTSETEFTSAVQKRQPRKIDIGAIFTHPPKDHHSIQNSTSSSTTSTTKFQPQQRELVFDIDLTDYDGVRKCGCSDAKICSICWKMMSMATKVMDAGLRQDFGFEHICWFYSGRRGVHCWVCDESARTLSDSGRSAVASYFEVNLGTEKNQNIEIYSPLHPCLQRAHEILEPMFIQDILTPSPQGHNLLGNPSLNVVVKDENDSEATNWGHHLLSTLPPCASAVAETLSKKWSQDDDLSTPAEKWEELKRYLNVLIKKSNDAKQSKRLSTTEKSSVELWPIKQVFKYTYPRLDINVSKMQNHLLKSPFCVHPKTGRVCVPIDVKKVEEFDPFAVPTLSQLMDELDAYNESENSNEEDESNEGDSRRKKKVSFDWQKTSLNESFGYFQKEFLEPMLKELKREQKVKVEKMAALTGDF